MNMCCLTYYVYLLSFTNYIYIYISADMQVLSTREYNDSIARLIDKPVRITVRGEVEQPDIVSRDKHLRTKPIIHSLIL